MSDRTDVVHAPHPPLTEYYSSEEERRGWVQRIFSKTAVDYDRMETILGFGSGSWYRRQALIRAGLKPGMTMLDMAMGTGLVTRQAAVILGDATKITGVDPSPGMLQSAKVPEGVTVVEGCAEKIPFPDNHFDFISMGYALRHISDLSVAFAEFHRVLKPGGKVCVLEITRPESAFQRLLFKIYLRGIVPVLAKLFARDKETSVLWRYYWDTIDACAPPQQVLNTLESVGFESVTRYIELGMFSEYRAQKAAAKE